MAERILYASLPVGLGLLVLGAAFWRYGVDVERRTHFEWYGIRYDGPRVRRFARGFKAGGLGFAALGLWCLTIWMKA